MPRNSKKPLTRRQKIVGIPGRIVARAKSFIARRPHRSFRLTKKRDYKRTLVLPGYVAFTHQVTKTVWQHRRKFIWLVLLYAALTVVLVGVGSQDTYKTFMSTLSETGSELFKGNVGQIGQATLAFVSIGLSGFSASPTDAQQIFLVLLGLFVWLITVWMLRHLLAGEKVKIRDGLYNAGSPFIPTLVVAAVAAVQLIPIGLAVVGYSAANNTGLLLGGVEAMLFWAAVALLVTMSLYWLTATFFAMIIVTIPGTYPFNALKMAGDMIVGRRLRILLRIAWMFGAAALAGAVIIIPLILIDNGLVSVWPIIGSVPVIPTALMLYGVTSFVWVCGYLYLLYRKVIENDATSA